MPSGRLLEWTPAKIAEFISDVDAYVAEAEQRQPREVVNEKGYIQTIPPDVPTVEEFIVRHKKKYSYYIYDLEKIHPEMNEAFNRIRVLQACFIQKYGINGLYNCHIVKIMAMNNKVLNWREKSDSEVSTPNRIILDLGGEK